MISGLIGAAFLALPISVLMLLNRGLDVSDTGHYYVSLRHFADIDMMSTQFMLIWRLLPLPDNIWVNRLAIYVLLMGSCASLFIAAGRVVLDQTRHHYPQEALLAAAGAGGGAIFYFYWLADPSYNSVGVILMALVLGAVFALTRQNDPTSASFRGLAMLAGFAGLGLVATRPVTALSLMLISVALVLIMGNLSLKKLVQLALFAILGAALFFVMVQVFIEPLSVTLERISGGLSKRDVLGTTQLARDSFGLLNKELTSIFHLAPWAVLMAAFGGAASVQGIAQNLIKPDAVKNGGAVLAGIGLVWIQSIFWQQTDGITQLSLNPFAYYLDNLGLIAILTSFFATVLASQKDQRIFYARLAGVCVLLVLATQSFTIFGTGYWLGKAGIASVFTVLACALVALQMARQGGVIWALSMASALGLAMLVTYTHFTQAPYRLTTPLAGQNQPTQIRGGHSTIRTDPETKAFFDALSTAADQMGPAEQRPILIDLTGRMPMVQYHLQARPPYTAWLLSTYKGSDDFLAKIIDRMSDEELARAWVLDAPGYKYRLDPAPIVARGLVFKRDYKVAATAFAPYIKRDIVLLAPLPRLSDPSPAVPGMKE